MAIVLSLLAALGYGSSDYLAGLGGRRGAASVVALLVQPFGLLAAVVGLFVLPSAPPDLGQLGWGALSGVGSGLGAVALYRGLGRGQMAVVAPVSGVLTALLPAAVGLVLGNRPGSLALLGIGLALPAVALISWKKGADSATRSGFLEGVAAGACFALLFIALDRAGTAAGTWPLVPGQSLAVLLIGAQALRSGNIRRDSRRVVGLAVPAGILGGIGNVLFLSATGRGMLAVVAVISSLYPAMTIVLARLMLGERWSRLQKLGLAVAAVAVALISL
ncbi:MAG: EamA family transporter [Candidatus Dormibacteria bacterium]